MSEKNRDVRLTVWLNGKEVENTLNGMTKHARHLRRELAGMTRGSKEYMAKAAELKKVNGVLQQHRQSLRPVEGAWSKAANGVNKYFSLATAAIAAITGVVLSLNSWVSGSAELADAQADVAKTTGLTNEELATLQQQFKTLNTRSSRLELLALAEEAGRLGNKSVKDVFEFVRVADQLKVALGDDLGGDEAIREVGKLTEQYKVAARTGSDYGEAMLKLGSAINEVSASGSNQAGFLVDYLKRLTGISSQTTLTAEQQLGFAAALDEAGQQAETSGTSMSQVITKMFSDTAIFAEVAGMQVEDFRKLLLTDTNEALIKFLEGLKGNNEGLETMAQKFDGLGIDGVRAIGVLAALSDNIDVVRQRQEQASKALQEGTSLTQEFNRKNENAAGYLEILRKRLYGAFVNSSINRGLESLLGGLVRLTNTRVSETMERERVEFRKLELQIYDTNTPTKQRIELINQLKVKYPDLLGFIDADTITNEALAVALGKVNENLLDKIFLQVKEEEIQEKKRLADKEALDFNQRREALAERLVKLTKDENIQYLRQGNLLEKAREVYNEMEDSALKGRLFNEKANLGYDIVQYEKALEQAEFMQNIVTKLEEDLAKHREASFGGKESEDGGEEAALKRLEELKAKRTQLSVDEKAELIKLLQTKKDLSMQEEALLQDLLLTKTTLTQEELKERKKAEEEIKTFLEGLTEDQLEKARLKYEKLLALADKHGIDRVELEAAINDELRRLQYEQYDEAANAEQKRQTDLMENLFKHLFDSEVHSILESDEFKLADKEEQDRMLLEAELRHLQELIDARKAFGQDTIELEKRAEDIRTQLKKKGHNDRLTEEERHVQALLELGSRSTAFIQSSADEQSNIARSVGSAAMHGAMQYARAEMIKAISTAMAATVAANPIMGAILLPAIGAGIETVFRGVLSNVGFAAGGYTGTGLGISDPSNPGRKFAGAVHDDEYVVNKELLYAPDISPLVDYIEARRTGKVAELNLGSAAPSSGPSTLDTGRIEQLLTVLVAEMNVVASKSQYLERLGQPVPAILYDKTVRDLRDRLDYNANIQKRSRA